MKTVKFEGVMENAYGKALPEPIKYEGSFEAFQTIDEVNEKHEYPTEKEIVDGVNAREIKPRIFVWMGGSEKINQCGGAGTELLKASWSCSARFTF